MWGFFLFLFFTAFSLQTAATSGQNDTREQWKNQNSKILDNKTKTKMLLSSKELQSRLMLHINNDNTVLYCTVLYRKKNHFDRNFHAWTKVVQKKKKKKYHSQTQTLTFKGVWTLQC